MEVYAPISLPELFLPAHYGLSSVVNWITPSDTHWTGGVQWDDDCTEVSVTAMTCISGAPETDTKEVTWSRLTRGARAFDVFDRVDCTPDKNWWETAQARALRALNNSAPTQLERTFQTGANGAAVNFPSLTASGPIWDSTGRILLQPASTVISGSPKDIVEGLGLLESAFGECYDGEGVVHAPVKLVAALAAQHLCYIDGARLRTYKGNLVAVGNGYGDIGPGGTTPPSGSTWMYMTGPVFGIQGQARTFTTTESLDRTVDTLQMIAERKYLLGWSCCLIAVLVTTGGEPAGAPGIST